MGSNPLCFAIVGVLFGAGWHFIVLSVVSTRSGVPGRSGLFGYWIARRR
ncbi:MAG: hypothetical protein JST64_14015 [Actinobacteria bacterium]|nr:hypothetical protein [Actinomycetota bacterium]